LPKVSADHQRMQRERILRAASRCFCRRGYHETTVSDICATAGLSKGGLYTYFKSKEALLTALVQASFEAPLQRARAAARGGRDALEKLDRVAEVVVEGLQSEERAGLQSPQLFLEIWAEASKKGRLNALCRAGYARWRAFLTDLLREGIGQGLLRPDLDPDALVTILLAAFDGLSLQQSMMSVRVDWGAVVRTLRRGLTEGIVRPPETMRR